MKTTEFYKRVKADALKYIGVPIDAWKKDKGGAIVVLTNSGLTSVGCLRNTVVIYHSGSGVKSVTTMQHYKSQDKNMLENTIDKLYKVL